MYYFIVKAFIDEGIITTQKIISKEEYHILVIKDDDSAVLYERLIDIPDLEKAKKLHIIIMENTEMILEFIDYRNGFENIDWES